MATYIYETIPNNSDESPRQFELQHGMNEPTLTEHPETGEPIRKVITGGSGFNMGSSAPSTPCNKPGGCGCHGSN